jgi:hypothetical protein
MFSKILNALGKFAGKHLGKTFPVLKELATKEKSTTIEKEEADETKTTNSEKDPKQNKITEAKERSKNEFNEMFTGEVPENAIDSETGELNDIYSKMHGLFKVAEKEEAGADKISQENFVKIRDGILTKNISIESEKLIYKKERVKKGIEIKNWKDLLRLGKLPLDEKDSKVIKKYEKIKNKISPGDFEALKALDGNLEIKNNKLKLGLSGNKKKGELIIDLKSLKLGEISEMYKNLDLLKNTKLQFKEGLELSREQLKSSNLEGFLGSIKKEDIGDNDIDEAGKITQKLISRVIEKGVFLENLDYSFGDIGWNENGETYDFDKFKKLEKELNTVDKENELFDAFKIFPSGLHLRGFAINKNESNVRTGSNREIKEADRINLIDILGNGKVQEFLGKLKEPGIHKNFNEFNANVITLELLKAIKESNIDFTSIEKNNDANNRKIEDNNKNINWGSGDLRIKVGSDWHDFDDTSDLLAILNSSAPSAIPNANVTSSGTP